MITTATAPGGNRGYSKKTPIYRESDTSPTCGNPTSNLSGDAHWLRLVETSQIIGRWKSKYEQVKCKIYIANGTLVHIVIKNSSDEKP